VPERLRRATLAGELEQAMEQLARAGVTTEARREATLLWAAVTGASPGDVWLWRDRMAPPEAARFREAVTRRVSGVPFAYAVGRVTFRGVELRLDPRALIPRPETEGLVDLVLRHGARDSGLGTRNGLPEPRAPIPEPRGVVADIGTGCGCIALALAVEGAFDRVIAVERSAEAAELARENVELVQARVPVEVRVGDLLAPLAGERCRAVVANPPYLTDEEYAALDPSVRLFEPRAALVSGTDGLDATRALLAGAQAVLEPGGLLALEIDERRADQVHALAAASGWTRVTVHQDLFGRPRYALAHAGAAPTFSGLGTRDSGRGARDAPPQPPAPSPEPRAEAV
jgi:release factor glutamine methyltransferase